MKANEIHYFSNLFDKLLYIFRTCPLSIIRSISTLCTQQYVFVMLVLLVSASVVILTTLADTSVILCQTTRCHAILLGGFDIQRTVHRDVFL